MWPGSFPYAFRIDGYGGVTHEHTHARKGGRKGMIYDNKPSPLISNGGEKKKSKIKAFANGVLHTRAPQVFNRLQYRVHLEF